MSSVEASGPLVVKANPDRKKVVVRSNRIPDKILNDPEIARDATVLPGNYNFEIHKTIWCSSFVNFNFRQKVFYP
jgi:hypothetical protein